jgi:hypothetical protein
MCIDGDRVSKEVVSICSVFGILLSDRSREVRNACDEVLFLKKKLHAAEERELILRNTITQLGYDKNLRGQMLAMSVKFMHEKAALEEENSTLRRELVQSTQN